LFYPGSLNRDMRHPASLNFPPGLTKTRRTRMSKQEAEAGASRLLHSSSSRDDPGERMYSVRQRGLIVIPIKTLFFLRLRSWMGRILGTSIGNPQVAPPKNSSVNASIC
jgi:hypothetical protein